MKKYVISTPRNYEQAGEKKTFWHRVGSMIETDDGKKFITLDLIPNQTFIVNEDKPKEETTF